MQITALAYNNKVIMHNLTDIANNLGGIYANNSTDSNYSQTTPAQTNSRIDDRSNRIWNHHPMNYLTLEREVAATGRYQAPTYQKPSLFTNQKPWIFERVLDRLRIIHTEYMNAYSLKIDNHHSTINASHSLPQILFWLKFTTQQNEVSLSRNLNNILIDSKKEINKLKKFLYKT